jgi:DNA polymerase-3 subunit chi
VTQIDFYSNVADKLATACRIAAKAYARGNRLHVLCPDAETAARLDRMLWVSPPTAFVPHCAATDALAAVTPIVLDHTGAEPAIDQVLLNLRPEWPSFFGRFERLVEIVSLDEGDKAQARNRFRFYRDRGYELRNHDLNEGRGAGAQA